MPITIRPRPVLPLPATPAVVRPEDLPPPPAPSQQCRDGNPLIVDWQKAQARIAAVETEAIKARHIANVLTGVGAVGALGGAALMIGVGPLFPVGLLGLLVGFGLIAASTLLRGASAAKVAAVTRRAEETYARAERLCRSLRF